MKLRIAFAALALLGAVRSPAQVPDSLILDGVPPLPPALQSDVSRYLEFRAAAFQDWHPQRREMLITTRFADASQLHLVQSPGGARRQITFLPEPVGGASYDPQRGAFIVFSQDTGGGEFYQLYRHEFADGRVTLLTDGQSRNTGPRWSKNGQWLAYTSTRRNGRDTDIYVMNPRQPASVAAARQSAVQSPLSRDGATVSTTAPDRLLVELQGGGWSVLDWSPDDTKLLVREYRSINESRLHLCDTRTGAQQLATPESADKVAWSDAVFAKDGKALFVITDKDSEFRRLCRLDLATGKLTPLTTPARGDVESFELSPDGRTLAYATNEDGASVLRLLDARTGKTPRTAFAAWRDRRIEMAQEQPRSRLQPQRGAVSGGRLVARYQVRQGRALDGERKRRAEPRGIRRAGIGADPEFRWLGDFGISLPTGPAEISRPAPGAGEHSRRTREPVAPRLSGAQQLLDERTGRGDVVSQCPRF
jgi:dipeptidyl aminopeptidase/acylaminoacyl peptidase